MSAYPPGPVRDPHGYGPVPGRRGPRLIWIAVAWALFVVLAAISGAGLFAGIGGAVPSTDFATGGQTTVTLVPSDDPVLYARVPEDMPDDGLQIECHIAGPSTDGLALTESSGVDINYYGTVWGPVFDITVPAPGEYQLRCDSEQALTLGVGTAIGTDLWLSLLLGLLAFVAALATTVVVMFKRSSARTTQ